jgi:hypothetical protein
VAGAYTLYHVKIENKNILQLRMSLLNPKIANKTSSIIENDRNQTEVSKYVGLHELNLVSNSKFTTWSVTE